MKWLFRLLSSAGFLAIILVFTLAINLALLFSSAFASAVSGLLGRVGVTTTYEVMSQKLNRAKAQNRKLVSKAKANKQIVKRVKAQNRKLVSKAKANKQIVKRVNQRIFSRTLKSAARSVAAVPVEVTPGVGIAAVVGITLWEVHDGCSNLNDLHELYTHFGVQTEYPSYQETCISYKNNVQEMSADMRARYDGALDYFDFWSSDEAAEVEQVESESAKIFENLKASAGSLLGWD